MRSFSVKASLLGSGGQICISNKGNELVSWSQLRVILYPLSPQWEKKPPDVIGNCCYVYRTVAPPWQFTILFLQWKIYFRELSQRLHQLDELDACALHLLSRWPGNLSVCTASEWITLVRRWDGNKWGSHMIRVKAARPVLMLLPCSPCQKMLTKNKTFCFSCITLRIIEN